MKIAVISATFLVLTAFVVVKVAKAHQDQPQVPPPLTCSVPKVWGDVKGLGPENLILFQDALGNIRGVSCLNGLPHVGIAMRRD
jgi:hypothetical protein